MLGRTKDQIRTTEQVNAALSTCKNLKLEGLVIIGGMPCFLLSNSCNMINIYSFGISKYTSLVLLKG